MLIDTFDTQCSKLIETFNLVFAAAKASYRKVDALVLYFEEEAKAFAGLDCSIETFLGRCITSDF